MTSDHRSQLCDSNNRNQCQLSVNDRVGECVYIHVIDCTQHDMDIPSHTDGKLLTKARVNVTRATTKHRFGCMKHLRYRDKYVRTKASGHPRAAKTWPCVCVTQQQLEMVNARVDADGRAPTRTDTAASLPRTGQCLRHWQRDLESRSTSTNALSPVG
jgi:hypothetical protein